MLLTVKKQVEETVELKTPAYYKDQLLQKYYFITGNEIVAVANRMIYAWGPEMGNAYNNEVMHALNNGQECLKEEFEKAYLEVMEKFENAVGIVNNKY